MKTDKFEKTIRQKLESISPDFQESDWAKMQGYMQVHTPPTFWQQYGSWLGYAAAASVTTVMAFMYVNQISQNNALRSDVKALQKQIAVIREKPAAITKTDTVYIVRNEIIHVPATERNYLSEQQLAENAPATIDLGETAPSPTVEEALEITGNESNRNPERIKAAENSTIPFRGQKNNTTEKPNLAQELAENAVERHTNGFENNTFQENNLAGIKNNSRSGAAPTGKNTAFISSGLQNRNVIGIKTLGSGFEGLSTVDPLLSGATETKMNGTLTARMSPKQVRKTWLASTANSYKAATADKKAEQSTQAENVVPKLNIKVPYRFGGGIEWQKHAQSKTVVGEVLISKKFSISAGVSWLKVKPMEFFTEKMFRETNKQDFKKAHPNEVPKAFVVTNIRVEPSLVQIPLTLAFRNEIKDNWSYYMSSTANITLNAKENISFNCLVPNPRDEFLSKSFQRKPDVSRVNSLNFSLGVEKSFHPIVVQAEGFMYTYFTPLTPLNKRTGPGFKVKLLYQIGRKM